FQCQENEFKCVDSDNECLPLALKCNGWQDCDDGFDEQNCEIPCTDDEYKCTGSGGCIPGNWQCDGMPDCSDGSDELECGGDGGWAEWSNWGECNVNCGTGEQTRSRYCEGEESQCVGEVIEYRLCHKTPCYMEGSDGCGTRSVVTQARIVGGENASPGAWPWQAQLYYIPWDFVACGGTLIGARHVISAAHCFQGDMSNSAHWKVRLGRHTLSGDTSFDSEAIEVDVAEVIVHPQYSNQVELNNDIAILVLAEDVIPSNKINYACMDIEHETHFDQHSYCFISGWGYTLSNGKQSEILQEAMVPLISQELCNAPSSYDGLLTENMMCAGYLGGGVDACQGDSGGPLVCIDKGDDGLGYWYLTGITSFGNGCANAGFPGVYTKISQYIEWLGDHGAL
ncbi:prostasin-like, partial [Saccoglossus kowalevskii]